MQNGQLTQAAVCAAKSPAELLGYLQQLSRDTAEGNAAQVLDAVVRLPSECIGAGKTILLHASPDGGPCLPIASCNLSWGLPADCPSPGGCIVKKAILTQTPQIADHLCDPLSACGGLVGQAGSELLVCIPVVSGSGPEAVLLCSRDRDEALRVWELEFLNTIANHAAFALRSRSPAERSVDVRVEPLERLHDTVLASYQLRELLDGLLPELLELMGADTGSVILCEDGRHSVVSSVGLPVGLEHEHHPMDGHSVSCRVLAGRRPVLLQGQVTQKEYPGAPQRPDVDSAIVAPLMTKRKPMGLLTLNRTHRRRPFTSDELVIARSMSQFIALALDNARLYDAVRSQARHFGNLYQIAKSVTANLQLQSLFKMIIRRLRTLVDCDVCAVFLRDDRTDRLEMAHGHGIPGENGHYSMLAESIIGAASAGKHVVTISDLASDSRCTNADIVDRLGVRSVVLATFMTRRKHSGAVAVFSRRTGAYTRQNASLVLGLAELAGIAIENARMYEAQATVANISQRELRPSLPSGIPGFQVGSKYAPAFRVGGDYYDLIRIDDHHYGLAIIDVAGKDINASVHVAMCKYALRALSRCITSPAQLMREMNRFIAEHIGLDGFVSMLYAVIDTETGGMTFCSAGHEPALLYRAQSQQVEQLRTPGLLLGVKLDATFVEDQTSIETGDVLLLYTDGLVEALTSGNEDASVHLEAILAEFSPKHPQDIANNMHIAAMRSPSSHSPDDIAIVAIKRAKKVGRNGRQ
jgi:GAF domain-containing protein